MSRIGLTSGLPVRAVREYPRHGAISHFLLFSAEKGAERTESVHLLSIFLPPSSARAISLGVWLISPPRSVLVASTTALMCVRKVDLHAFVMRNELWQVCQTIWARQKNQPEHRQVRIMRRETARSSSSVGAVWRTSIAPGGCGWAQMMARHETSRIWTTKVRHCKALESIAVGKIPTTFLSTDGHWEIKPCFHCTLWVLT